MLALISSSAIFGAGRTRRMTLGAVNVLPLDQARERARVVLAEF